MKNREVSIDLIKTISSIFVIAIHFFSHAGFYKIQLNYGKFIFFLTQFRGIFMTCVPLFFIITGYLSCNRKFSKKVYKNIFRILIDFFLIFSIRELIGLGRGFFNIIYLDIFMYHYIVLTLLIPYFNVLYNNLEKKKYKIFLIIILFFIISTPNILNLKIQIFPYFWVTLYPYLYYFIGMYIKEYKSKFKINKYLIIVVIFLLLTIQAYLEIWRASLDERVFKYFTGYYDSPFTVICATSIFLLLMNFNTSKIKIKKLLTLTSNNTFKVFLFSMISDAYCKRFFSITDNFYSNFPKMIIFIFTSYIMSLILSILLSKFESYFEKIIQALKQILVKKF